MTDRIVLSNMRFTGRHGVREHEKQTAQPFEVDVELSLDLVPAGRTDDLSKTVNYELVFEICRRAVESERHQLIESLAESIAGGLLEAFSGDVAVDEVRVRVRKPRVGLPGALDYAGVDIARRRDRR